MMKLRSTLIFFVFSIICGVSTATDYGLLIKSYPYKTSELTSLVLEEGKPIVLDGETTLAFDLYVRKDNVFGNICRIVTDKEEHIDLLFTVGEDDRRFPIFVINESIHPTKQEITREQWINVSITFDPKNNQIRFRYGDTKIAVSHPVAKSSSIKIAFGTCPFEGFALSDVASVNIKNIKILKGEKLERYWKLEKHYNELCYDSVANIPAVAHNPQWLIDDHISWNKIFEKTLPISPSVAYSAEKDAFFWAIDSRSITVFNTLNLEEKEIKVAGGLYAANAPNQLLYIPENEELMSYNMDENIYSFFSFNNRTWSNTTPGTKEHSYWNNSVSYAPMDSCLISFGGYGFYRYNNEMLKKYPYGNKPDEKILLTEISPRYSAGTAIVDNTLYIFGGRGNKSGRQELYPKNFYDFYAVDLHTRQVNKLWETTDVNGTEFVSSENLIYDAERKCFYMFTNKAGGMLLKITTDRTLLEPMSLPLGEDIDAHFLYTNLYYSPKQKKLFALMNKTGADNSAEITIYSMNYPPISVADLSQQPPIAVTENKSLQYRWIVLATLTILVVGSAVFYLNYRRRRAANDEPQVKPDSRPIPSINETVNDSNTLSETKQDTRAEEQMLQRSKADTQFLSNYDFSKCSICLLGDFQVRDKEGNDITSAFTPTLKALLILLILYSGENERGVSGRKMLQLLWSDKGENSARNNRNVYLSRLRVLLEKIGHIDVLTEGGFWAIKAGEDVTCDYSEAMRFFKSLKEEQPYDEERFNKLLELLLRGTLLPNTEIDWIDRFKSDFSNLTIDTLSSLLTTNSGMSNNLKLKISETLFQHDFINEEALYMRCRILSESGKMGLAKTFYDNYCKEYHNLLGAKYKYSLPEVLQGENLKNL